MAHVKAPDLLAQSLPNAPYGGGPLTFKLNNLAAGGVAQNDYFYLAKLPAGTFVHGLERLHETGGAGVTASWGYLPVYPDLGPPPVDNYWFNAADVSAIGRAASAAHPIKFDYPVYLVVKNVSAAPFAPNKYVGAVLNTTFDGMGV